jgi:hypothetical protein
MKKLAILVMVAYITTTIYSQKQHDTLKIKDKNKITYRVGKSIVSMTEKQSHGKYGEYTAKEFKVEKIYKKGDNWESTNTFNLTELLQLRAAIDKAISEEGIKTESDIEATEE